jgi:hypothetical protein
MGELSRENREAREAEVMENALSIPGYLFVPT